jgi:hypothetical protein
MYLKHRSHTQRTDCSSLEWLLLRPPARRSEVRPWARTEDRVTPSTFWLGPAGVDESRGAEDEAVSLDSDSVTGYGEKYLDTTFGLEEPTNEQNVSGHAPSLNLPLSKNHFVKVSLRKQLSMLLDIVLLLGQLSQPG